MEAAPDRRTALLTAALRVLGRDGMGAVTHRAVEREAGLPAGSTTYYFPTRQRLIDGIVGHLLEVDHAGVDAIAHELAMAIAAGDGPDHERIAAGVTAWIQATPGVQIARYELHLAGTRRAEIRELMRAGRETFVRVLEPIAVAAGSADPRADAGLMLAMLDGVIFQQLTSEPEGAAPVISAEAMRRIIGSVRPA